MAATNKKKNLRWEVGAAVATLLGLTSTTQAAKPAPEPPSGETPSSGPWSWDTSLMWYKESDRIAVVEPQVGVRREFADQRSLTILATVDTISGATPLGTLPATANTAPNTITSASGRATNPDVGKVPTNDMSDTRLALSGTYERPMGRRMTGIFGGQVAKEHDFLSLGTNVTFNRYYHQKNTTLSFGVSPEFDIVSPKGGLPYAYATQLGANEFEGRSKTKYLIGGLVGVTQVINRRTLMQFNYSPTYENGYLNDPYKLLSLVNTAGDPLSAIHERRPGSRLEHSFYWLTRYNFTGLDVFSLGLRYFSDNWGIHSQTIDFTYRWQFHERRFLEPHVRYYHQTQADFFRVGLLNGQGLPDYASADYRLNAIDGVTFGVRLGWKLRNNSELILRAEYYSQTGEQRPNTAVGAQRAFDLFPTLDASILQIQYTFTPSELWSRKNDRP